MSVYEVQDVVANIDSNIGLFLVFGLIGMACNWALLYECVRLGFRDKTFSVALFSTYFWTAHDIFFISLFHFWFQDVGFWVWKLFWVNICGSVLFEVIFYYQMIKYGLDEIFPGLSKKTAIALLFGGQIVACIIFGFVKMMMGGDPMFMGLMSLTIVACPIFSIGLALRRGSSKGQSVRLNVIYIVMICGIWPAWAIAHPVFRGPLFILLGFSTILWCLANIYVLKKLDRKSVACPI